MDDSRRLIRSPLSQVFCVVPQVLQFRVTLYKLGAEIRHDPLSGGCRRAGLLQAQFSIKPR